MVDNEENISGKNLHKCFKDFIGDFIPDEESWNDIMDDDKLEV